MKINPAAVVLWMFLACIGFLIGGTVTAAVTGFAIGLGISILLEIADITDQHSK